MSEFSQTVPELVAWARKNDFSISLPVDRLSFLLAVATLNGERLDGEMSEGELVDAFRHVSDAFEQTSETIGVRANNAINDMVRQRLLNRFTSEQAEGNAIYRLTPLYHPSPAAAVHPSDVASGRYCRKFLLPNISVEHKHYGASEIHHRPLRRHLLRV